MILKILRWVIAIPLIILLVVITTIGIPATTISTTVTDRGQVKSWLRESGMYTNFKNLALDTLILTSSDEEGGSTYLKGIKDQVNDPNSEIGLLLSKIAYPEKVEESVNTIIDAYYDWLKGKTEKPTYSIVITDERDTLIQLLSVGFKGKVEGLPECDASFVVPPDFNPIEADCRPKDFDYGLIEQFIRENIDDETFSILFDRTTFHSESININPETTKTAQDIYQIVSLFPLIFFGILFFIVLCLVLLIPNFKNGLKDTGLFLISVSLIWIVFTLFGLTYFENLENIALARIPNNLHVVYFEYFQITAKNVYSDILVRNILISVLVMIFGAVLFGSGILVSKKKQKEI